MAARTSSSSARAAIALGVLSLLAIPAGVGASRFVAGVTLLESLVVSVPIAFVLALLALAASRRARLGLARSVFRDNARTVRLGRFLAWAGLYVALTGGLTLAFYGVLRWAS